MDDQRLTALTGLWAYAHVSDVRRSLEFYAQLGLEVRNTHEEDGTLVWAFVTSSSNPEEAWARLMLALTDEPVDPGAQGVLFYCWTSDARRLHAKLRGGGIDVGEIEYPFYMPAGEFRVVDPDGYVLLVGQLNSPER
jgi:catechol 2,3-dioxygenase-like lactoylglutathione lyase family enzyme